MIHPDHVDRLARNIAADVAARTGGATGVRTMLDVVSSFAVEHELDTQDVATLIRLIAGEGTQPTVGLATGGRLAVGGIQISEVGA